MTSNSLISWVPADGVALPSNAEPPAIVERAVQLSPRDQKALITAFQSESYEMAASFAWSKALAALKKQLAALGMDFVGEMLGRSDLDESSNPITDVREDEAIDLAEQLGMISTTEAIRLRASQTLVNHFLDPDTPSSEQLFRDEATSIVRTCVVSFLAEPATKSQRPFLELRAKLESENLDALGQDALNLAASPYFFVRTTLTVLLAQLKSGSGAKLEHAAGNINVLLPVMWPRLRDKDKWQTGEAFAIAQASNRRIAAAGLRTALMKVKGFDFVPETLRSDTFRGAARAILTAHYEYGNFANEVKPVETLFKLGSSIPIPAIPDCMTAALCVKLGNRYGHSWAAETAVEKVLKLFRPNEWSYYLDKVIWTERRILEKLAYEDKPLTRWQCLVSEYGLDTLVSNTRVTKMVTSNMNKRTEIKKVADVLRKSVME